MRFHSQDSIGGDPGDVRETSGLPRNMRGSGFIDFIRLLSIFIVFDYENTYDREKVAFTLTLWRRKRPQCESERDFFTIICVFTIKTPLEGGPRGRIPQIKTTISLPPKVGDRFRRSRLPFRPHLPAHIPRMTLVAGNSLKLL